MLIKVYSLFTLADARSPEIDQGARLRWLAECVWLPYGFVGDGIAWEPIDGRSARATLLGDGLPVSAVVEIDEEGKLTCIRGDRYRDLGGVNSDSPNLRSFPKGVVNSSPSRR